MQKRFRPQPRLGQSWKRLDNRWGETTVIITQVDYKAHRVEVENPSPKYKQRSSSEIGFAFLFDRYDYIGEYND